MSKRVVIYSGAIPTTTFIDALIYALAEEGYEMVVVGRKVKDYSYPKGVETIEVPKSNLLRLFFILKNIFRIKLSDLKMIVKESESKKSLFFDLVFYMPFLMAKPDYLHIQWSSFIHKKELLFKLFQDKVILSLRGAHINYTPIIKPEIAETYRQNFPKVYKFHAVSEDIKQETVKYNADADKIQVIYSYVKDEIVEKELKLKAKSDKLRVISIGRFFWKKGYDYALDALYKLKNELGVDFVYTLVAQGGVPDDIKFQIHQMGLTDNVKIINGLPHAEVIETVKNSDVMLLSSVEEGIANVVLEAMAVGTLVVSTDCGGMEEVIVNNESGYIVHVRDVNAMADALQKVHVMDEHQRLTMAQKAQQRIIEVHNKKRFTAGYKELYN